MIDNLIKEWIHQEMSFLKNLFKGKPAHQNTDDQVSLLIPQVRQVFAEIKSSTQISWTAILPTASRLTAFMLSIALGRDDEL